MLANASKETAASVCMAEVKRDILGYGQYRNSHKERCGRFLHNSGICLPDHMVS
jgi:hypothetical protein